MQKLTLDTRYYSDYDYIIDAEFLGLELVIGVDYTPEVKDYRKGHPDNWEEGEPACYEFELVNILSIEDSELFELSMYDQDAAVDQIEAIMVDVEEELIQIFHKLIK